MKRLASAAHSILVRALELALDERPEPVLEQLHRLADTFVIGDRHGSLLARTAGACAGCADAALAREARDLGPALHEAVVGERLAARFLRSQTV